MNCPFCGSERKIGGCCVEIIKMKLKNRTERLKRFMECNAPEIMIEKEKELIALAEAELQALEAKIGPN